METIWEEATATEESADYSSQLMRWNISYSNDF